MEGFFNDDFQVDEADFESLLNRAIENSRRVRLRVEPADRKVPALMFWKEVVKK